jgi:hypothetical protein
MNQPRQTLTIVLRRALGCALLCLPGIAALAADAPPVLVTEVHGSARGTQGQLALLDRVKPGDVLDLGPGAVLVLFQTAQAQQFSLAGPGRFYATLYGVQRQGGSGSVRLERQDPAFAGVLRRRDQVAAGAVVRAGSSDGAESIALSQPVLRWRARPHRGQWTFRLIDELGQVLFATTLAQTTLTLSPALRLQPGQHYRRELRWEGRDGSVQLDVAPVQVLGADDEAELIRLAPPPDAPDAALVLYALYLRNLGVRSLADQVAPGLNELDLP